MNSYRERRLRQWSKAGQAPPHWWGFYSEKQLAALNVICVEIRQRGGCALSHKQIGQVAGIGKGTIQAAVRIAVRERHLRRVSREAEGLSNVLLLCFGHKKSPPERA